MYALSLHQIRKVAVDVAKDCHLLKFFKFDKRGQLKNERETVKCIIFYTQTNLLELLNAVVDQLQDLVVGDPVQVPILYDVGGNSLRCRISSINSHQ